MPTLISSKELDRIHSKSIGSLDWMYSTKQILTSSVLKEGAVSIIPMAEGNLGAKNFSYYRKIWFPYHGINYILIVSKK